ncbi:ATP-binding cassette domain-containing protein [Pedococcus sp. P5_B7]
METTAVLEDTPATQQRSKTTALEVIGVTKSFPGVRALDSVNFDCMEGEVHALVGENGSGKSTMIKAASGVYDIDEGRIVIGGEELGRGGVQRSRRLGLITAYQDTSLVNELTVADNIALSFNAIGEAKPPDLMRYLGRFDLPFRQSDLVAALGPGARQLLEVARAMAHRPKVLMLDEPTAALDMKLAEKLEEIIRQARDDGTAIVYVSHRLAEVRRLADRLTVIRDGEIQGTYAHSDWAVEEIVELMVGAPTSLEFPDRTVPTEPATRLELKALEGNGFGPVSLIVGSGEIVGIAGAEGNGQRQLLRGIIGMDLSGGSVAVEGKTLSRVSPSNALKSGISFQSGDRVKESIFPGASVMDNATSQYGEESGPYGTSLAKRLLPAYRRASKRLNIVAASPYMPVEGLSGGNQQKVVLARPWLRTPEVLIVDEPTQGVDARARLDIYATLTSAAQAGVGVLVNSSDSSELAGLCDRVYVMSRGVVVEEIVKPESEGQIVRSFVAATDVSETQVSLRENPGLRWFDRLAVHTPIIVLLILIAALALYTGSRVPVFWSTFNLSSWLILTLPLAFVALAQQYNLISGLFDISIGSVMSLTVVILSFTLPDMSAGSILKSFVALVAAVLAVGAFNSVLIENLKVTPIVATVASLGVVQGVAIWLRPEYGGIIAPELNTMFAQGVAFIPTTFILVIVLSVALEWWLYKSRLGLALRATGLRSDSALRVGWRVNRIRTGALFISVLGAVVGGIVLASQAGAGSNGVGSTYALPTFAAVFLGGAVMTGGRGSFIGALLGALFLSLINNAVPLLGIQPAWAQILNGLVLLVAIAAYAGLDKARLRALRRP